MTDAGEAVLVAHSGRFGGQSLKIAQVIATQLSQEGLAPEVRELTPATDLTAWAGAVLVGSVQYGHFSKALRRLVSRHRADLDAMATMFVSVSLTARKPEKRDPTAHTYTRKFLEQTGWQPGHVEVAAGALRYPTYRWWDRRVIQLIMKITDGPTDPTLNIEYTDWDQLRAAASAYAALVRS